MNHLKQLSQYEWFVSRTETSNESVDNFELGFSVLKYQGRGLRDPKPVPLQKAAKKVMFL